MVQGVEGLEEPGLVWGGGGGGGGGGGHVEELQRELKRLQRKVCNTLDGWLEFYRTATGTLQTSGSSAPLTVWLLVSRGP